MPNRIEVTGHTSKKGAELRFTPNGAAVAGFSLAGTNSFFDKTKNEYVDDGEPLWFNVTVWQERAELAAEQIPADGGSKKVTVTGKLRARSWDDKDTGEKRQALDLVADSVYVHPPRPNTGGGNRRDDGWASDNAAPRQPANTTQQPPQAGGWGNQPGYDQPPF